jgi:hypothetical protein
MIHDSIRITLQGEGPSTFGHWTFAPENSGNKSNWKKHMASRDRNPPYRLGLLSLLASLLLVCALDTL